MEPVYQYPNALDELCGQVTPEQFTCLLSVLSSSDSSKSTLAKIDNNDFTNNTGTFQGTSWSSSSRQSSSEDDKARELEIQRNKGIGFYEKQIEKFTLPLAIPKPNDRLSLLQFSSFDSAITPAKSGEEHSSFSRFGVTSKDSMLALKGVPALEEHLAGNIYLAETKYSQFPLPIIEFQGEKISDDAQILAYQKQLTCFHQPVCKRIMGKCMGIGRLRKSRSRSSSVESVLAETLPDLDNSLVKIAGKIANEPVNHFPVLRKGHSKKSSYSTASSRSKLIGEGVGKAKSNVYKIEQEFTRELDKYQDFQDVSEFFSHPKSGDKTKRPIKYNLSTRVTNPLYKEYDPTGYHKNEDELALECMQMICDDFNKWIKSLSSNKIKSSIEKEHVDEDAEGVLFKEGENGEIQEEAQVIDPEFLIQILRTELELPEE